MPLEFDDVVHRLERDVSRTPACPRHLAHPVWYQDGAWWCERDTVPFAALGELGVADNR
jgi:hypothetical protein